MTTAFKKRLLIIDDDRLFCDSAKEYLSKIPADIYTANSGQRGLDLCSEMKMDIVLLDQRLPDIKGTDLYRSILSKNDLVKIIFITAFPDLRGAVNALKEGAHDYIAKPFDPEELSMTISRVMNTIDLERVARIHEYTQNLENLGSSLVGSGSAADWLRQIIKRASENLSPVFITGETGTGKNSVAKAIHYWGSEADKPFLTVNCAAIPENLIESELFGVEKGAFTGAIQSKKGIFELAEGGTLLLDEIGELPVQMQSKLLGVLDERKYKKVGGSKMIDVNVRIIAATNVNIESALKDKNFRKDLYFRLNIIPIHIPPLRERPEDIPELAEHFINKFSKKNRITISGYEIERLKSYDWPGNIRELSNIIERSVILRTSDAIMPSSLISNARQKEEKHNQIHYIDSPSTLKQMEESHIRQTLENLSWNYTKASKRLGISRSTLMRKIEIYGLDKNLAAVSRR